MKHTSKGIYYFRRYYSKRFETRLHMRSTWSRLINPSLKDLQPIAFQFFLPSLVRAIPVGWDVAAVPSHKAGGASGIQQLAAAFASTVGAKDLTGALSRSKTIMELHNGGDRSAETHFRSVAVKCSVRGRRIVLLDDVTVTGYSLLACRTLLLKAGATRVKMLALARGKLYKTADLEN